MDWSVDSYKNLYWTYQLNSSQSCLFNYFANISFADIPANLSPDLYDRWNNNINAIIQALQLYGQGVRDKQNFPQVDKELSAHFILIYDACKNLNNEFSVDLTHLINANEIVMQIA